MKKRMMIKYELKNQPRLSPSNPSPTEMDTAAQGEKIAIEPSKDAMESTTVPHFDKIEENIYLFDRRKSKCKKDIKRMVCDCILTKEERKRNILGCGEDCLNRMLMIECGSRCPLRDHCANKRFQKKEYASVEPFNAGKKGWGLRTTKALPPGAFIMEYVGEVVDPLDFKSRVKKYSKEKYVHHYFMALKSDEIIDATVRGSITRFVNHSCDPNTETQKWTVNGELRIGFFTTRVVEAYEEITLDYQFQRYGKEAQKCYCESSLCRGFIGANEVSTIDLDGAQFTPKQRRKIAEIDKNLNSQEFEDIAHIIQAANDVMLKNARLYDELEIGNLYVMALKAFESYKNDIIKFTKTKFISLKLRTTRAMRQNCLLDLGEEIEKIYSVGCLRNRQTTLNVARLMVRAEDSDNRRKLLEVLKGTQEIAYLRLFLDYHGLQLLWSWMVDQEDPWLKCLILEVLEVLPIPNRTILVDSKVLEVVDKWSKLPSHCNAVIRSDYTPQTETVNSRSDSPNADSQMICGNSITERTEEVCENSKSDPTLSSDLKLEELLNGNIQINNDNSQNCSENATNDNTSETKIIPQLGLDESIKIVAQSLGAKVNIKPSDFNQNQDGHIPDINGLASKVLNLWKDLKEGFKIPRLVRQKRKDDEKEADEMASKSEERNFRGMSSSYIRRGADEKDYTIASILKRNQINNRRPSERKTNGFHNGYNYNTGGIESTEQSQPAAEQLPKLSKEEHRMQFEKELMRKQYEEAMKQYQEQIAHYTQMLQQYQQDAVSQQPSSNYPALMLPVDVPQMTISDLEPSQHVSDSLTYDSNFPVEQQEEYYAVEEYETFDVYETDCNEPETFFDLEPVPALTECSGSNNDYMSDDRAVLSTDYGIEYVPQRKRNVDRTLLTEPGVYYECGDYTFMAQFANPKLPAFDPTSEVDFTSVKRTEPELLHLNARTALPKYWRRGISTRTGNNYFYNKKTGEARWSLPDGPANAITNAPEIVPEITPSVQQSSTVLSSGTSTPTANSNNVTTANSPVAPKYSPVVQVNGAHSPCPPPNPEVANHLKDPRKRKTSESVTSSSRAKLKRPSGHRPSSNSKSHSKSVHDRKAKKALDKFKVDMIEFIKKTLNSYRKSDCKVGKIVSNDDFKYLAKKLSSIIIEKEEKNCKSYEDLACSETVKTKAKEFIKKYMASKGPIFKMSSRERHNSSNDSPNVGNSQNGYSDQNSGDHPDNSEEVSPEKNHEEFVEDDTIEDDKTDSDTLLNESSQANEVSEEAQN